MVTSPSLRKTFLHPWPPVEVLVWLFTVTALPPTLSAGPLPFESLFIITSSPFSYETSYDTGKIPAKNLSSGSLSVPPFFLVIIQISQIIFFTKSTGPETPFPISTATILIHMLTIPNSYCDSWSLKKVFLALSLSSCAPSTISITSAPSLLFIIIKLKYTNMTFTDFFFFFPLPLCRAYAVTYRQQKGNGFWNHADPRLHPGFAIYSLYDLNKLYNLSWLQLPHLRIGINNSYLHSCWGNYIS